MIPPLLVLASLLSALAAALVTRLVVPSPRRLAPRVRPYTISARSSLGGSADVGGVARGGSPLAAVKGLFGPLLGQAAARLGRLVDRTGDEALETKLRQARLFPELLRTERVAAYRVRQLLQIGGWGGGAATVALMLSMQTPRALGLIGLGLVVGAARIRGRLDRAIDDRRQRMRIEIYTVNQLLAVRARAGGGVIQAVSRLVERGRGEVVSELAEALRWHRSGLRAADAFRRLSRQTPEPFCARTYALLAVAEERGVDLAEGLLALSEDVREGRREAIRRVATKRRAAMLVPTIAILAPVMLLFVGAPLPRLVLGWQ